MKLKAPANMTGISVGGEQYDVDKDGFITVPDGFDTSILNGHGFDNTVHAEAPAAEAPAAEAPAAEAPAAEAPAASKGKK